MEYNLRDKTLQIGDRTFKLTDGCACIECAVSDLCEQSEDGALCDPIADDTLGTTFIEI